MKIDYKISTGKYTFGSKTPDTPAPGQVEYSNDYFLNIEKEATKAHIQHVIQKSEADEVLKYKQKGLFSQLKKLVKSHIKK